MFSKVYKKLKNIVINYLNVMRLYPGFSKCLKKGLYLYKSEEICKANKFKKGIPFIVFGNNNIVLGGGNSTYCFIKKVERTNKILYCFENYILADYKYSIEKDSIINISKFINKINYPKPNYLYLDEDKKFLIYSYVQGEVLCENKRVVAIGKDILKFNTLSDFIYNFTYNESIMKKLNEFGFENIVSYIQHGDMALSNVIFDRNTNHYKFIDFDHINILPMLYDLMRLLQDVPNGYEQYIEGIYDDEIKSLFSKAGVDFSDYYKDMYLSIYFIFQPGALKYLSKDNVPLNYVFTNKLIKSNNNY